MFKFFRLLPGALSSLQVIVVVISVLDAVFYPHTVCVAWRKAETAPLNTVHILNQHKSSRVRVQLPSVAPLVCVCSSSAWYVSAHSGSTAFSPAHGACKFFSVSWESPSATLLLMSATAPATGQINKREPKKQSQDVLS